MSNDLDSTLSELEIRLRKLQGNDSSNEEQLQQRLANLEPERLEKHTFESLTQRFTSIFGTSTTDSHSHSHSYSHSSVSNETVVDAFLAATRQNDEADDWYDEDEDSNWNGATNFRMAQNAFLGSNSGSEDAVTALLMEAQDMIRISAKGGTSSFGVVNNVMSRDENEGEEEGEDDEVAAIIRASQDEALLDSKYGPPTKAKKKRKRKKNSKKNNKKKSRTNFSDSSNESSNSSDSSCSSDSSSATDDSSDSSDFDEKRRQHRKRKPKRKTKKQNNNKRHSKKKRSDSSEEGADNDQLQAQSRQQNQEIPVNKFQEEEEQVLNRLRDAVRNEGRDSELVNLLATRLVQIRKAEKVRLKNQIRRSFLN